MILFKRRFHWNFWFLRHMTPKVTWPWKCEQRSYLVWNTWKSMEFNFPFSRSWIVWNLEFRYGKVWIFVKIFSAVQNFCMPVYFSCNLMKSLSEFCWNWLELNIAIKVIPQNYQVYSCILYLVTLCNGLCLQFALKCKFWDAILHFLFFISIEKYGIWCVCRSIVGVWTQVDLPLSVKSLEIEWNRVNFWNLQGYCMQNNKTKSIYRSHDLKNVHLPLSQKP